MVNPYNFCYEVVAGIVYTMGLLGHTVEVFLCPEHSESGVADLLRLFFTGPISSLQDLPLAAHRFDTIVYADWYPKSKTRFETKLEGGVLLAITATLIGCRL